MIEGFQRKKLFKNLGILTYRVQSKVVEIRNYMIQCLTLENKIIIIIIIIILQKIWSDPKYNNLKSIIPWKFLLISFDHRVGILSISNIILTKDLINKINQSINKNKKVNSSFMGKVACPHFSKSTVYLLHPTKHTPHNSIYYYYYYYREIQKYFFI